MNAASYRRKGHRIIALILCFVLFFTSLPGIAFAESKTSVEPDAGEEETTYEEQTLQDTLILEESVSAESAVLEDSTENTTIFDLGDGKKVAVFHGGDVRYEDEEGNLTDYEPQLVPVKEDESLNGEKLEGYLYENKTGDTKQYIPEVLNEETPILMEKEGYSIKMTPIDKEKVEDEVEVIADEILTPYEEIEEANLTAVYAAKDDSYTYEYTSLSNGIKESIVLTEQPENNVFSFSLETKGLIPILDEKENVINLQDKESGESVAVIDKPFMNDASGEAYSEDLRYTLEEIEAGAYRINLTVSKKYLNDEKRLYPVTIDPTATWKGNEMFQDTYAIDDAPNENFFNSNIKLMKAGEGVSGTYQQYIKLPNIKGSLSGKYIDSAIMTVYEFEEGAANQTIRINRITSNWDPETVTWNNRPTYGPMIAEFTTKGVGYKAHQITMTAMVRNFINETNNANYGVILRNMSASPKLAQLYGSRTSLTAYRPKLVITYYDKPTALETMSISRKGNNEEYITSNYLKRSYRGYVTWTGIQSHNLADVQYKIIGVDGTAQPTSISSDQVDLTSYRSLGVALEKGTNVSIPYSPSLPAGKYRLYLRGKDAGGMYGGAKYKTFYVDGDTPSLTGVSVTPATTTDNPTKIRSPKITWTASDSNFSKVTIKVTGGSEFTTTTSSGTKSVTLATSRFSSDGTYTIRVRVYDKTGKYTTKNLTYHVDTVGPAINSITTNPSTSASKKSNNINPKVNWNISDANLEKVQLYLDDTLIYTPASVTTTSVSIASKRFPKSGTYTFTLKATDAAGNVSKKSINYYVDIDAPVIDTLKVTPSSSSISKAHISSPTITWTSGGTDISKLSYSMDNSTFTALTDIDGSFRIPAEKIKEGKNTIYVRLHDKAGNISAVKSVNYYYEPSTDYVPEIKNVTEYYGKRFITWDVEAFDEDLVSYELHRGATAGFTPSADTLVEDDIDELSCLYVDQEILDAGTYYYKLKAVSLSSSLTFNQPCSNGVAYTSTVTADQFANTMGQKPYLDYLDAGLPNGTVYVEKSSGNLLYEQSDFALSNSQLDYGMDRVYNSMSQRTSMIGKGWTDSYHKEIYTSGENLYFVDTDGSSYFFEKQDDDSYLCAETKDYTLDVTETGYVVETKEDITYTFNHYGQLIETTEPNGCTVTNTYDRLGRLERVESSESISGTKVLHFVYEDGEYQLDYVEDLAGTKYAYDCTGNMLKEVTVTGADGDSLDYQYIYGNTSGKLETIKDGEGNAYNITYASGKADTVSYPDGEGYHFIYTDGKTETEKVIPLNGSSRTMYTLETIYNPATGKVLSFTDAAGDETAYEYVSEDSYLVKKEKTVKGYESITDNVVTVHQEENVVETEYTYDENDNVETESTSDGTVTTYEYDEEDNMISEVTEKDDVLISSDTYTYDANGNMTSVTDEITGTVETYEYEDKDDPFNAGNATKTTVTELVSQVDEVTDGTEDTEIGEEITAIVTEVIGPETETEVVSESTYAYGENTEGEQTISSSIDSGTVFSNVIESYDVMGRLVSSVENGVTTTNVYDFLGRVTQTTVSEEGKVDIISSYAYNDNGTLVSESSSIGTTKTYTYDNRNRKVSETVSGSDMNTRTSYTDYGFVEDETIYDGISERTEDYVYTETNRNTAGQVVSTTYVDISGNTVKEVAGEASTHYTYDKSGNAYATYMTDAEGTESMLTLSLCDAEGNNFAQISQPEFSDGNYVIGEDTITSYTDYDEKGNVIRETDGNGIVTTYAYDDENRLASCNIDDTGDEDDITVSYASTSNDGLITTITDANGNMKTETQDWNGLITGTSDINMHPEAVIDEDNDTSSLLSTTVEYDTLGRKTKEIFIDQSYIVYTYTGSSANISKAASYRKTGEVETLESETTYTYDNADRLISAVVTKDGSNVSSTSYTYDAEGKKLTETVSYGLGSEETIIYSYDAEGRRVSTNYPDGSGLDDVTYTYDTWGNLLTASHDGEPVCEYTYDGLGQLLSMKEYKEPGTDASGYVLRTYSYDSLGRCTSIRYLDNGSENSLLESFVYTYDKNSQILTCRHINNLPAEDKCIDETRTYTYDSYGQLTESIITDHKNDDAETVTTYTYDKVGNRTAMSRDGQVTEYTYNGLNQLMEAETADAIIKYIYDGRGNQIEEYNETEGITTAYTYAVTGEMTGMTVSSGDVTTFTQENQYNHEGIRISKTEGGVTRRYYYDNGIVAYTKDGATVSSANVLSGDGDILGTYRGEDYHVYTKDVQNSSESIIKSDGSLAAVYSYTDFGETEELTESSLDNEICYTGAVYDAESGLYYMNARYYDPANGRFISQDTYRGELDDHGQWHLYAYCANNPINYVDPSGHAKNNLNRGKTRIPYAGTKLWLCIKTTKKKLRENIAPYFKRKHPASVFVNWALEEARDNSITQMAELCEIEAVKSFFNGVNTWNKYTAFIKTGVEVGKFVSDTKMYLIWKK